MLAVATLLAGPPLVAQDAAPAGAPAPASPVLVAYGFDQEVATGPDTLRVFANARGRVGLSRLFAASGTTAVQLVDVAGDGDFPELLGSFPLTRTGRLLLRFALLVTDPRQELNAALAGPGGFGLGPDGIALWLATRDGFLWHTSDSIPRRLLALEPFVWYLVEARYDVDAGRYGLAVGRLGEREAAVTLRDQPNAASTPASAVSVFSFIGDNGDDLSRVSYFVDDVLVARDEPAKLAPFVAPGRRRYFVDLLLGGVRPLGHLARCPALADLSELGIDPNAIANASPEDAARAAALVAGEDPAAGDPLAPPAPLPPGLAPLDAWARGCAALARGAYQQAQRSFDSGLADAGDAFALLLGRGLALAARGDAEAAAVLEHLGGGAGTDPRTTRLAAAILAGEREPAAALAWLAPQVEARLARDAAAPGLAGAVAAVDGTVLAAAFHLHLATGDPAGARALAHRVAAADAGAAARWLEWAGHAAFLARDLEAARADYTAARVAGGEPVRLDLALADVAHLAGDVAGERRLREGIYGRLAAAEE